jgi:stage V sporulation protein G
MAINGLEITDVIVFPVKNKVENSSLMAFARIIINDQFIVNGLRIFEGKNGPFVRLPQEYNKEAGKGYDICFPITAEMRSYISDQVLSQYSIAINMQEA